MILILEQIVKEVFEQRQNSNKQDNSNRMTVPIGIKQYGSQASSLAVDSSDVDLAVTGLKLNADIDIHIREMRKLFEFLKTKRAHGWIKKLEIIDSATVPLIKMQVDLQVIQEITRNKAALQA